MMTQFGFLDLGAPELIIILAIILLLFGGKKLPELSKSIGESMHELRKGISSDVKQPDKKKDMPIAKDKTVTTETTGIHKTDGN
jgi:sec-independent protein translocase protein TatA